MQSGKKPCYQTTSLFFLFCILNQLCLIQHSINFLESQRKLVGEFLGLFLLYTQQKGGISELYLSILNTSVIVREQVTVMNKGFGFHA